MSTLDSGTAVAGLHLDVTERVPPGVRGHDGQVLGRNPLAEMDDGARETLLIEATSIAFGDVALIPVHHQMNLWAHRADRRQVARMDGYTRAMDFRPAP